METVWTPERVESLTKHWAEGLSARQIASKLGGISRNAVIGKAHRLNLHRVCNDAQHTEHILVPEAAPMPEPIAPPDSNDDLEPWRCRWPTEEPGRLGRYVCGGTAQPGRHYCAEHLKVQYLRNKKLAGRA